MKRNMALGLAGLLLLNGCSKETQPISGINQPKNEIQIADNERNTPNYLYPPLYKLFTKEDKIAHLIEILNNIYTPNKYSREELAKGVNEEVTDYIENLTGKKIETSASVVRLRYSWVGLLFPFASAFYDDKNNRIILNKDRGLLEPFILAHEFAHAKGYEGELEAQITAYFALRTSNDPIMFQSAILEELLCNIIVLEKVPIAQSRDKVVNFIKKARLKKEPKEEIIKSMPPPGIYERAVSIFTSPRLDHQIRSLGGNGISDYCSGFLIHLDQLKRPEYKINRSRD
ncbi:hypothetical protein HYX19_02755 [Candidatus Woesearchaeota archaeon]|nr:hypothetical protein [Candidatus Woesearchaeota archaeon]